MNPERASNSRGPDGMTATAGPSPLYSPPAGIQCPLRIVLVVPQRIPAWLSTFLDLAAAASWIEVSVLPVGGARLPKVANLPLDTRALLAFERARRRQPCATLSLVPIHPLPGLTILPAAHTEMSTAHLAEALRPLRPDLVLSLGPQAWTNPVADLAKWGCWNLDAGLVDPDGAGTVLLAPVLKDDAATQISLELELQRSWLAPVGMAASWGATRRGSFGQQRERAFLKLPMLLLRMLRRLAVDDLELPQRHAGQLRLAPPEAPLGLAAGARALVIAVQCSLRWQLQKRRPALPWVLVMRQDSEPLNPQAPQVRASVVIQAPAGDYWADPCVVDGCDRPLVFVEEMTPAGKGAIACLELAPGAEKRLGIAIEEPQHLSFPQVFHWHGQWYATVESSAARRVSLYRANAFPLGWQRLTDLVSDRVCVDPILHFHDNRWYLFTTIAENGNSTWDELFLFVADDLAGPFQPHPANPILSDVRRARPAGRLFERGGRLIRPSQDCASDYGSAVVFNEVLELTPTAYRERPMSRLAPDWSDSLVACHTYSAAGDLELLDARGQPAAGAERLRVVDAAAVAVMAVPEVHGLRPAAIALSRKGAVDEL